jgi:hypothetical protein
MMKMLNIHLVTSELPLSNNTRLRFLWNRITSTLIIETLAPKTARDGHGFMPAGSVRLTGEELEAFVSAIAALQEPELRPAA